MRIIKEVTGVLRKTTGAGQDDQAGVGGAWMRIWSFLL